MMCLLFSFFCKADPSPIKYEYAKLYITLAQIADANIRVNEILKRDQTFATTLASTGEVGSIIRQVRLENEPLADILSEIRSLQDELSYEQQNILEFFGHRIEEVENPCGDVVGVVDEELFRDKDGNLYQFADRVTFKLLKDGKYNTLDACDFEIINGEVL